jgi:hypothetical protein
MASADELRAVSAGFVRLPHPLRDRRRARVAKRRHLLRRGPGADSAAAAVITDAIAAIIRDRVVIDVVDYRRIYFGH